MMKGCICRDDSPVAQLVLDTPHIQLWRQSLYFDICTIQSVRNHGRVYLISVLVVSVFVYSLATIIELRMNSCQTYNGK